MRALLVWLPEHDPERGRHAEALARALPLTGTDREHRAASILLTEVNGGPALDAPIRPFLEAAGFVATSQGLQLRDVTGTSAAMPRLRRPGHWGAGHAGGRCPRRARRGDRPDQLAAPAAVMLMPMPDASCRSQAQVYSGQAVEPRRVGRGRRR